MAVTYSRNLRLRIDSNLTANSKYNLERLDLLGASLLIDTSGVVNIRSEGNINIEPQSPDVGGSGLGGSVNFGSANHQLDSINFHAASLGLGASVGITDSATGGTRSLLLQYKSDLSGSVDTGADRALSVDLDGADRSLILGANLSLLGSNLSLTLPAPLALTLPVDYGNSGQILSSDGTGVLSWVDNSAGSGGVSGYAASWLTADGTTKVLTHGLGSADIQVSVIDLATDEEILIDSILATSTTLTLTSSEAPASSWRVIAQAN